MVFTTTVDPGEIEKFSALAAQWWDPKGQFAVLHKFNPVRLEYIRKRICAWFKRDCSALKPFEGLRILDIGCGGGLVSEPLARLGARVVGVDPAEETIKTAMFHAREAGVEVDYRVATARELADAGEFFDVVLGLEVVEHVAQPAAFIRQCALLVRPGGAMILSTLNRTLKSFALAIIGAEYVLGWLPRGTHRWEKFITPEELGDLVSQGGLVRHDMMGVVYKPLSDEWALSKDLGVNYMIFAVRAG
ncbi:MAG: bifunctional 2-polyprenyl-6-hydroxyphenol methylase/3-demethylubiquinol 3-O-methyltransferase UbiG [Hyphomicrobiales bacterium]